MLPILIPLRPIMGVLQIGIRAKVMSASTILVPTKDNLRDPIEIRRWKEIKEELLTLRDRANKAETEGITLCARVRSLDLVKTWLYGIVRDEREARERIECQLGLIQEELESIKRSRLL
ncbi:hypothetical protein Tco_0726967 [Tanacetum coccineum]|uniref:Uncharacterized protein n=1 Tax=Tanacetum coccineum TaxID=301880 RepID=A0ABQ4YJC3_9ASTR